MIGGIPVALGPVVVLALGLLVSLAASAFRRVSVARVVGLGATSIALGLAVRLGVLSQVRPIDFGLYESFGASAAAKPDLVASAAIVVALLLGLVVLAPTATTNDDSSFSNPTTILLATLLACLLFLVSDLTTLAVLWTALVLVGAGQRVACAAGAAERPQTAAAGIAPWLGLALVGAPVLWVASALATDGGTATGLTAALGPTRLSVRALLVVVGAASAGLAPLGGWLRSAANDEKAAFIADGLLPLVGLALAARALGLGGAEPPASLAGLLVLLGLCGCAEAAWSAWRGDEADGVLRVIGRADAGLAFLGLAAGSSFGVAAATFVVGAGVLARAIARTTSGRWPAWIAWASLAGFPGFAGFVGRWLLLAAIFASGQPLLALSAALASVSLGVATFRATVLVLGGLVKKETEPHGVGIGGIVAMLLIVVAGLAPSPLLLAAIAAAIAGPLGAPGWSGLLVWPATLVALLPLIVATPFLNRKRARRSDTWRKAERRLWGAAQHVAERTARLAGAVDARYDLAVGLLVAIATLFAFGS